MSRFRTLITAQNFKPKLVHQAPILCIGSCFAEHMNQRLTDAKFTTLLNPFGIVYNPHSIGRTLEYLLDARIVPAQKLVFDHGLWHSLEHHSRFSKSTKPATQDHIQEHLQNGRAFLKNTSHMILTFGTSNAFVFKKSGEIVANCHKLPNNEFDRITLSIEQIISSISPIFQQLRTALPDLEIILSISPVRHLRDGTIENQRSKARLLLACDALVQTFDFVHYFPAYEIMMDELRDYRFYDQDMIHPSPVAIDYIWDYFSQSFFSSSTKDLIRKVKKIKAASEHLPFHQASEEHQVFVQKQLAKITQMEIDYPYLKFDEERQQLLNPSS